MTAPVPRPVDEALATLHSLSPYLATSEPQHRVALREAWAVLDGEIREPAADTKEDA